MKGEVTIKADGKSYTFVLGAYGLAMLHRKTGVPTGKYFNRPEEEWGFDDILSVFQAGLKRHHGDVSDEEASDIIDCLGYEKAVQIFQESIELVFSDAKEGDAPPPKPAASGTGKTSSRTG